MVRALSRFRPKAKHWRTPGCRWRAGQRLGARFWAQPGGGPCRRTGSVADWVWSRPLCTGVLQGGERAGAHDPVRGSKDGWRDVERHHRRRVPLCAPSYGSACRFQVTRFSCRGPDTRGEGSMKSAASAVCALVLGLASAVRAQDQGPDHLGIYADAAGTVACANVPPTGCCFESSRYRCSIGSSGTTGGQRYDGMSPRIAGRRLRTEQEGQRRELCSITASFCLPLQCCTAACPHQRRITLTQGATWNRRKRHAGTRRSEL